MKQIVANTYVAEKVNEFISFDVDKPEKSLVFLKSHNVKPNKELKNS